MGRGMSFLVMQCRAATSCSVAEAYRSCTSHTGSWLGIEHIAYMVVLGGFGVFMGIVVARLGVAIDRKWLVDIQACNI